MKIKSKRVSKQMINEGTCECLFEGCQLKFSFASPKPGTTSLKIREARAISYILTFSLIDAWDFFWWPCGVVRIKKRIDIQRVNVRDVKRQHKRSENQREIYCGKIRDVKSYSNEFDLINHCCGWEPLYRRLGMHAVVTIVRRNRCGNR